MTEARIVTTSKAQRPRESSRLGMIRAATSMCVPSAVTTGPYSGMRQPSGRKTCLGHHRQRLDDRRGNFHLARALFLVIAQDHWNFGHFDAALGQFEQDFGHAGK